MKTDQHQPMGWNLEEGHLILDFLNTAYITITPDILPGYRLTDESLNTIDDLATWATERGVLRENMATALRNMADTAALAELTCLLAVREAVRQVIRAQIQGEAADPKLLVEINQKLLPALQLTQLMPTEEGCAAACTSPEIESAPTALAQIHWALGFSVMNLLTDRGEMALIHECPGEDCGYLFRDASHGRRKWCSMRSCGNRAKVASFRERQKAS